MSTATSDSSFWNGRPATGALVLGVGVGSAAFNVYGAHGIYAGLAGLIFGFVVLCMEGLAITSLRHVLTDWENNNYVKAALGGVAFSGIVTLCMYSGYRAFDAMNIEATEANSFDLEKVERLKVVADEYFAAAAIAAGSAKATKLFYAEQKLKEANDLSIEVKKKAPPPFLAIMLFLGTLEAVKMVGRFALATPSKMKWSWTRRKTEKAKDRAKLAEAIAAAEAAESNVTKLAMSA